MLNKIVRKPLLLEIFITSILVALLHQLALSFYLYWTTWWFDVLMHFLGGVVIGLLAVYFFFVSGYVRATLEIKNLTIIFLTVMASILVVGLTWELWEIFAGFSHHIEDRVDTIKDLVMDVLGAIAAFYYSKDKLKWRKN